MDLVARVSAFDVGVASSDRELTGSIDRKLINVSIIKFDDNEPDWSVFEIARCRSEASI
jgi:hypothetical protein